MAKWLTVKAQHALIFNEFWRHPTVRHLQAINHTFYLLYFTMAVSGMHASVAVIHCGGHQRTPQWDKWLRKGWATLASQLCYVRHNGFSSGSTNWCSLISWPLLTDSDRHYQAGTRKLNPKFFNPALTQSLICPALKHCLT